MTEQAICWCGHEMSRHTRPNRSVCPDCGDCQAAKPTEDTREALLRMADDWARTAEDMRQNRGQRTREKRGHEVLANCAAALREAASRLAAPVGEKGRLIQWAARLVRAVCAPTPDDIAEPVRLVAIEMRNAHDMDRQREAAFQRVIEHRNRLLKALKGVLAEPHGCSLCDSGVARSDKGHQPDCPYEVARAVVTKGMSRAEP